MNTLGVLHCYRNTGILYQQRIPSVDTAMLAKLHRLHTILLGCRSNEYLRNCSVVPYPSLVFLQCFPSVDLRSAYKRGKHHYPHFTDRNGVQQGGRSAVLGQLLRSLAVLKLIVLLRCFSGRLHYPLLRQQCLPAHYKSCPGQWYSKENSDGHGSV